MNEVEYIKSRLDETERLLGLTEEALELALAALKLASFSASNCRMRSKSCPSAQ